MRTWLFGIARLKCQQAYRNRKRRAAMAQTFLEEIREQFHVGETMTPEQLSSRGREVRHLHDGLAKLPDDERILLNLRYWRALPVQEIASIMGKSPPTVRKRLARAEQHLKESMADETFIR